MATIGVFRTPLLLYICGLEKIKEEKAFDSNFRTELGFQTDNGRRRGRILLFKIGNRILSFANSIWSEERIC